MKKHLLFLGLCQIMFLGALHAQQAWVHPELERMAQEQPEKTARIGIYLHEQVNAEALKVEMAALGYTAQQRAQRVIHEAYALQNGTQQPFLGQLQAAMPEMKVAHAFWVANIVLVDLPLHRLPALRALPEVFWLFADESYQTALIEPTDVQLLTQTPESVNGREPGINVINAPSLWGIGYTGKGRKAFTVDTGTWTEHPSLARRFLGNYKPLSEGWFSLESRFPVDRPSHHGTHVNGTIVGLEPSTNDTIGVAYNAYFMASNPLTHSNLTPLSINLLSFEWALNPDGDTSTVDDIPDVINNSWGQAGGADTSICVSWATQIFDMVEAAGVAIVFSAGNEGPGPSTVKHPQFVNTNDVNIFSIGAINGNLGTLPIANFSSRGPSLCGGSGSLLVKPEVVAPGVNVRSAYGKSGYAQLSGTSMSSPHVSGAIVLLKEAFPYLGGDSLMYALYMSAIDMGDPGEDNTFGRGRIDVLAAYNYLAAHHTPVPPASTSYELALGSVQLPPADFYCPQDHPNGINASLELVNEGDSSISLVQIQYRNTQHAWQSATFNGPLAAGQSQTIALPNVPMDAGWNALEIRATLAPGTLEGDSINNFRYLNFFALSTDTIATLGIPMPASRAISADQYVRDSSVLIIDQQNDDISWDTASVQGLQRDSKAFVMRHSTYGTRQDQQDDLITQQYFGGSGHLEAFEALSFRLAYRNRNYAFADSLRITVECDCGADVRTLYYSGGDSMKTYSSGNTPTDSSHWRAFEFRNLILLNGPCFIRFRTINDFGGNVFIGDMEIRAATSSSLPTETAEAALKVYPNPFDSKIVLESALPMGKVVVVDVQGRQLMQLDGQQQTRLAVDAQSLQPGIYFIRAEIAGQQLVKRLVKQ